jgi:hypothetical protein
MRIRVAAYGVIIRDGLLLLARLHGHSWTRHLFVATVVGGKLTHEVGGTTDQAGWFALEQVPDLRRVELVDVALNRWRTAAAR